MASRRSTHSSRNTAKRVRQQQALARDPHVMADHEVPEDLEAPISYEDALRYLRRQKLYCRGPLSDEHRATVTKLLKQGKAQQAHDHMLAHRGVLNPSTKELEICGFDLTDLIVSSKHPLDGSELAYECPKCGNAGTIRPARFNLIDQPRKARR